MFEEKNALFNEHQESEEYWWMVLIALLNDVPKSEWEEFEHGLKYVNRFSSTHTIVDVIKGNADKVKLVIEKGKNLFRARVYRDDPLLTFLADIYIPKKRNREGIRVCFQKHKDQ